MRRSGKTKTWREGCKEKSSALKRIDPQTHLIRIHRNLGFIIQHLHAMHQTDSFLFVACKESRRWHQYKRKDGLFTAVIPQPILIQNFHYAHISHLVPVFRHVLLFRQLSIELWETPEIMRISREIDLWVLIST